MQLQAIAFRGTTRFRLVRFIGRGGMGVVYEAFDEVNGIPVAVKLLPIVSPDLLLRFKREFRTVADVRHPNLVRLGELVSDGSQWFFTMELVNGIDLATYVRGADPARLAGAKAAGPGAGVPRSGPTLPGGPARDLDGTIGVGYREDRLRLTLAQLARALAALHAAGCVHRDVKPTNVLVTPEGRAVLLDFGLVRESSTETTFTGAGTPEYMAPEQVAQAAVTGAADWYALGVILFELLTGQLPFRGLSHEILYRKQYGRPPKVAEIAREAPADLAALCDGLLEPDPQLRWSVARVLEVLAGPPPARTSPRSVSRSESSASRPTKRPAKLAAKRGPSLSAPAGGASAGAETASTSSTRATDQRCWGSGSSSPSHSATRSAGASGARSAVRGGLPYCLR